MTDASEQATRLALSLNMLDLDDFYYFIKTIRPQFRRESYNLIGITTYL